VHQVKATFLGAWNTHPTSCFRLEWFTAIIVAFSFPFSKKLQTLISSTINDFHIYYTRLIQRVWVKTFFIGL